MDEELSSESTSLLENYIGDGNEDGSCRANIELTTIEYSSDITKKQVAKWLQGYPDVQSDKKAWLIQILDPALAKNTCQLIGRKTNTCSVAIFYALLPIESPGCEEAVHRLMSVECQG